MSTTLQSFYCILINQPSIYTDASLSMTADLVTSGFWYLTFQCVVHSELSSSRIGETGQEISPQFLAVLRGSNKVSSRQGERYECRNLVVLVILRNQWWTLVVQHKSFRNAGKRKSCIPAEYDANQKKKNNNVESKSSTGKAIVISRDNSTCPIFHGLPWQPIFA